MDGFVDQFLNWEYISEVFPELLRAGLVNTLILAGCSAVIGTALGMVLVRDIVGTNPYPLGILAVSLIAAAYIGGDLPVRHPECRQRTNGGQPGARDDLPDGDAPGRHPAGRAPGQDLAANTGNLSPLVAASTAACAPAGQVRREV